MLNFRLVSKEQFYAAMRPLDVHPQISNDKYPYSTEWRLQKNGRLIVGKSIGKIEGGVYAADYFLA